MEKLELEKNFLDKFLKEFVDIFYQEILTIQDQQMETIEEHNKNMYLKVSLNS